MSARKTDTYVLERGGTLLAGRYRVIELLGVGGMGSVWIAEHLALKRRVVVKFHEEAFVGAGREVALKRFLREARALSAVRHRNVCELHEAGRTEAGEPYLILELLAGQTLAARARHGEPMSIPEAIQITIAICQGLEAVHAAGVLHRDVKPENIFLHEAGGDVVPKLIDFGLARSAESKGRITQTGNAIGTPGYMAPEQARGLSDIDHRADLHALGVTLYEMLTGELPHSGESPMDLLLTSATEEPTPLSTWNPRLRGPLEDVVMKAIARDPDDRFPSARSMRLALTALTSDAPKPALASGARRPPPIPAKPAIPKPKRSISQVPGKKTVRPARRRPSKPRT